MLQNVFSINRGLFTVSAESQVPLRAGIYEKCLYGIGDFHGGANLDRGLLGTGSV
jgi:hypothetical protein